MAVVKVITLIGESPNSWQEAADNVVAEVEATLHGVTRIGIVDHDIRMKDDKVDVYRVRAEVSFRVARS